MHCGQMLAGISRPAVQPTGAVPQSYAPHAAMAIPTDVRKRNTWLAVGVAAALILILLFGLKATGVLNFGQKPINQATLTAKGQLPDTNLLQAQGSGTQPTLQSSRITMPQDLYDWLEHLRRCEQKKQAITGEQDQQLRELQSEMQGASGLTSADDVQKMTDPDYNSFPTLDKATAMLNQLQPDWVALKKRFDSVPPPEECKPIAQAYDGALQNIIDTFASVEKIVSGVNLTDKSQIQKSADDVKDVGLHHRRGIDGSFQDTDDLVQQICDKYQTRKWFKIDAHGGSAGLMGY